MQKPSSEVPQNLILLGTEYSIIHERKYKPILQPFEKDENIQVLLILVAPQHSSAL